MTVRCKEDERHARDEPHASLVLAVCAPVKQEGAAQSDVHKNVAVHKWRRWWWWWWGAAYTTREESGTG